MAELAASALAGASSRAARGVRGDTPATCMVCGGQGHAGKACVVLGACLHRMTSAKADVVDIILQFLCDWSEACFDQEVRCVSVSPRGDVIAAGERGGSIQLVCTRTGEKSVLDGRHKEGHVLCVAWSPCGRMLASGGDDQIVYIWGDGSAGGVTNGRALGGHQSGITSVAWSPSAQKLASASYDESVRIWDSQSGVCESSLTGHTRAVTSLSWSRDGTVVSSSDDKTAKIWAVTASGQGKLKSTVTADGSISCVGFSPCGCNIAAACNDGFKDIYCVKIFRASGSAGTSPTFLCERTLSGHERCISPSFFSCLGFRISDMRVRMRSAVFSVAWAPDGSKIASGSYDKTVRVWDSISGECERILAGDKPVWSVAFSYADAVIAAGTGDLSRGGVRRYRYAPWRAREPVQQSCNAPAKESQDAVRPADGR